MASNQPFFAPGAMSADQIQLSRQQKLAEMLQQQSMETPQAQMVSGHYVAPSITQHLARLGQALASRSINNDVDQKTADLYNKQKEAGIADMNAVMDALNGKSATPGYQLPADQDGPTTQPTAAIAGDPRAAMARALSSQNPMVQSIGADLLKQQMKGAEGVNINGQLVDKYTGRPMGQRIEKEPEAFTLSPGATRYGPDGKPIASVQDFNKPFLPDGSANSGFQNYEITKSKAGAPKTSINVDTATKPFLSSIGQGVGEAVNSAFTGAQAAVQTLNNVDQIRSGLSNIITGPGANVRIKLSQVGEMLGINGKDETERLQNTRSAIQGLARQELAAAGSMKGQGQITEAERGIMKRAEAGEITDLTEPEINTLLDALEKTANYRIGLHESNMERLKNDPNAAGVVDFMQVQRPTRAAPTTTPQAPQEAGIPPMSAIQAEIARRRGGK